MNNNLTNSTWNIKQRIIHYLMLKTPLLQDLGLFNGKMGIAIAFYLLSRENRINVYRDFAEEILDLIFEEIHEKTPLDFNSGLLGIGWGLEFLIQHKFVEGSSLDICDEIDNKLLKLDIRRIENYSLGNGLHGIINYVLIHIKNCIIQNENPPFDNMFISDLYEKVNKPSSLNQNHSFLLDTTIFKNYVEKGIIDYNTTFMKFWKNIDNFEINKIYEYKLGIQQGLASKIIKDLYEKNFYH